MGGVGVAGNTSVGGTAYGYDADGNLTSGGGWSYTYDDEGRLTAASGPSGHWSYQYDALGNRAAQTNSTTTTQYLVDPTGMGSVVAEFGGGGNLVSHFTYGLGLTSSLPASGNAQFYQFDGSANTVAVTGAGGSVLNSYWYLPFGEKVSTGSVANSFTYAGQLGISDDGDGLYYMRARYYDPTIGRFISEDPLGFGGGSNFYAYTGNNPTSFVDPQGLTTQLTQQELQQLAKLFNGSHIDQYGQVIIPNSYTFQQVIDILKKNGFPVQSNESFYTKHGHSGFYQCRDRSLNEHLLLPQPKDFTQAGAVISNYSHNEEWNPKTHPIKHIIVDLGNVHIW